MEILVKGVLPAREQLIGRCEICGCVVKFNTTEGRRNPNRDDDKPFHGTTYELECPTYGCRGTVSALQKPKRDATFLEKIFGGW